MAREIKSGQQCEYTEPRFENGALTHTACLTRHNDRTQGPPKQIVSVKEGRIERLLCLEHAEKVKSLKAINRKPRPRAKAPEEQLNLLTMEGGD